MAETQAIIETKFGNIELKFFPEIAPNQVNNFMSARWHAKPYPPGVEPPGGAGAEPDEDLLIDLEISLVKVFGLVAPGH